MLMMPAMADFIQAYGQGGLRAQSLGVLDKLARVYWYTVEFGLVRQSDGLRLYGAGIASSASETRYSVEDASPNRIGFELERVMRTRYCIDDFQETYFVLEHFDEDGDVARVAGAIVQALGMPFSLKAGGGPGPPSVAPGDAR